MGVHRLDTDLTMPKTDIRALELNLPLIGIGFVETNFLILMIVRAVCTFL